MAPTNFSRPQFQPRLLTRALASLGVAAVLTAPLAQAEPAAPALIKVLVGFPAGAGTDNLARIYADVLAKELGSNVVVENRPGAGGQIAATTLKNATPDGSTLMMAIDHQIVMLEHVMANPGFKALEDFAPIVQTATYSLCVAVHPSVQANDVREWAEQARQNPAIANVGVPSLGSNGHFMGDVLARHLNVKVNVIPYKGASPLLTDVIGGHVDTIIMPCGDPLVRNHEAGRLRIIGVTSEERLPHLPDVPSLAEAGVDSPSDYFLGVYASSEVPADMLTLLRNASLRALSAPGMTERLATTGLEPRVATADEFDAIARRASQVWGDLISESGFEPQ